MSENSEKSEKSTHQLSDTDSVHLSIETENAWGHIGGLTIVDPSDAPNFGFEQLVSVMEERITLVPRFTWKLQEVAFGLDRPYWVDCPSSTSASTCTASAYRHPAA